MKKLKAIITGAFLTLCALTSSAQEKSTFNETDYNKPKLFADLPQKMNLNVSELQELFKRSIGSSVNVQVTDNFIFQGTIVSKSDEKDASIKSIVIRSTNRQGAAFTFTRIRNSDGTFKYKGRILSFSNGDAFEIVQEKGQYFLQKKNLHEMIAE